MIHFLAKHWPAGTVPFCPSRHLGSVAPLSLCLCPHQRQGFQAKYRYITACPRSQKKTGKVWDCPEPQLLSSAHISYPRAELPSTSEDVLDTDVHINGGFVFLYVLFWKISYKHIVILAFIISPFSESFFTVKYFFLAIPSPSLLFSSGWQVLASTFPFAFYCCTDENLQTAGCTHCLLISQGMTYHISPRNLIIWG